MTRQEEELDRPSDAGFIAAVALILILGFAASCWVFVGTAQ